MVEMWSGIWRQYIFPWSCTNCEQRQPWFTMGWFARYPGRDERYCENCCNPAEE
jgi:hypothetical protein